MSQMEGAGPAETGDLPGRNGDGNLAVAALRVPAGGMPEDAWAYDDFGTEEEGASAGLASGPLLGPALRRGAWLWCLTAVMGLLAGLAFTLVLPPAPQASTTVLVAHNPNENPADAIVTDVALAQSRTVAVDAMRRLGLPQTPKSITKFQGSYTLSMVTDRLILFTVKAPTTSQAVLRARVLANDFLQLRAHQLQGEQQLTVAAIDQQIAQGKKQIAAITKQIAAISPGSVSAAQPTVTTGPLSPAQKARVTALQAERGQEEAALTGLEQAVQAYQVSNQVAVSGEMAGSQVLDAAAPVHRSLIRHTLLYVAAGLVVGLALGLGIVIVQALVSGRLRRRDDIARALGAPIQVSVGRLRAGRLRLGRGSGGRDVQRLVAHLRTAVPARAGGAAALAVVAVDNAREVAPSVVALAVSYAREGKQVVLADLAGGAPAARLLGITKPGTGTARVNTVRPDGMPLVVVVPGRDSAAPAGPLPQPRSVQPGMPGPPGPPSEAVATAYASADLLISLVTLDPALGADHLPTWADTAVVAVTAAVSSGIRIHAVGEMIRIAGTPLVSTVLIGADKNDESLGAAYTPDAGRGGEAVQRRDDGQRRDEGQRRDAVERPDDDTEDFEVVPDSGADANGSRAPELWWPRARA